MTKSTPVLAVEDLCVDFATRKGRVRVLNGIRFHLRQGETLGVVGESGCGKSMTALAIMRLIPIPPGDISGGRVLLNDRDLLGLSEKQMQDVRGNEISMIFQEPMTSLNPVFTIGMQIAECIQRHQRVSRKEAMEKTLEMLVAVRIPAPKERLRQYPHELSGGLRQRVMIAMALSCRPTILIADEPTTALDVTVQAQIFELLEEIQKKMGTSMILITHDMGVISEIADRVIVMYAGRKVEEGPVTEIIENPHHPYTQGLLGCAPDLKEDPGPEAETLKEIPGIVPDLSEVVAGCPFQDRCEHATKLCRDEMPPPYEVGAEHVTACWLMRADS